MGIFDNADEGELAFKELLDLGVTPGHLRWFFCMLAIEGPVIALWTAHKEAMGEDFRLRFLRQNQPASRDVALNYVLEELQDLLSGMGKRLRDIGLPEPVLRPSREVETVQALWGGDPQDLQSFSDSLTRDQVCLAFLLLNTLSNRLAARRVRALANYMPHAETATGLHRRSGWSWQNILPVSAYRCSAQRRQDYLAFSVVSLRSKELSRRPNLSSSVRHACRRE
jgi:hypothetical protein